MTKVMKSEYMPPTSLRLNQSPPEHSAMSSDKNFEQPRTPTRKAPLPLAAGWNQVADTSLKHSASRSKLPKDKPIIVTERIGGSAAKRLTKTSSKSSFRNKDMKKKRSETRTRNKRDQDLTKHATANAIRSEREEFIRFTKEAPMHNEDLYGPGSQPGAAEAQGRSPQTSQGPETRKRSADGNPEGRRSRSEHSRSRQGSESPVHLPKSKSNAAVKPISRALTQPQTGKATKMRVHEIRPEETKQKSIFQVVDDIMSSLVLSNSKERVAPSHYALGRSPEAQSKKQTNLELFESANYIKEIRKTNSHLRGAAGPGSATAMKAKTRKEVQKESQRNLLLPNQTAKMAALQMRRASSQARARKPQPQIRVEPPGHTNKQDATRQLVPIEPSDSYHLMPTFLEDDDSTDLRPLPKMIPTDQS